MVMVMMSSHSEHAKQIHAQTQRADEEQLICVHLGWLQAILLSAASVKMIEKKAHMRWIASKTMKIEMRMRKMPFAKPDKVSMRP